MSFGNKLGRGLGIVGALAVEGAVRGAEGLGQFGADVVDGAQRGYEEKHAALLITREQQRVRLAAERAARIAAHQAAMNPGPMVAVATPVKAKSKA